MSLNHSGPLGLSTPHRLNLNEQKGPPMGVVPLLYIVCSWCLLTTIFDDIQKGGFNYRGVKVDVWC